MNAPTQAVVTRPPPPASLGPPPTTHTLKPHHLQILKIFSTVFHQFAEKKLPSEFLLHMYRILLEEVAEVRQPATYKQLMAKVESGVKGNNVVVQQAIRETKTLPKFLKSPNELNNFFKVLPPLFASKDNDESCTFSRHSVFGYFTRRCFVSFIKLSFEGVISLFNDFHKWVADELDESTIYIKKDIITNAYNIFKTSAEKKEYARADAYDLWEKGLAIGDEITASENLRRFFEQHFHELNDSNLRQHALLNLARMHYIRHEAVACRKLLEEAITVARTNNDRLTLAHAIGLLNRLAPIERGRKMVINEIQPDIHPSEVLYDVKKLLVVNYQQPLSAAFERISQVASLYDMWSSADILRDYLREAEHWGQHAVQSIVWSMLGSPQLAAVEENIVTAFTDAGGSDNTRLVAILNRAYREARQGKYRDAISMLLHPDVWSGLDIGDYQQWATQIWHILVLRASRRGQNKMFIELLSPKRFLSGFTPKDYMYGPSPPLNSPIRDPLHEVLSMREANQGHSAIQPLLTSLWHSEFQQRFSSYRPAVVLLADIGLEFGMTKWCRRIVDEIMPQVITGDDIEQRAFACFTAARCIIAAADDQQEGLKESLPYLIRAESDYAELESLRSLSDAQFLLSVVYHNLGQTRERDEAAKRQQDTEKLILDVKVVVVEDWITEVLEVVTDVGAALATR